MMHTKAIDAVVKMTSKAADGAGEFEAVLSAPTLDRDGEIIDGKAFEPLPDRINIDLDHSLKALDVVASGVPFYDGDVLKLRGVFASTPKAQEIRSLVTEGHLRNLSVTYGVPEVAEVNGVPHITKAELWNATFATIPANRDALVLSAKAGARNSAKDSEAIQAMHDSSVYLGAACAGKAHKPAETKTPTVLDEARAYIEANGDDPDVVEFVASFSTNTDPESDAAAADTAAADAPADVEVARALVEIALAEAELTLD